MNFSVTSNKISLPDDMRAAFDQFMQREMAAQGPEQAVKALYESEPEQLSFHFEIPKQ